MLPLSAQQGRGPLPNLFVRFAGGLLVVEDAKEGKAALNGHWSDESLLLRVIGLLVLSATAVFVAVQTEKGRAEIERERIAATAKAAADKVAAEREKVKAETASKERLAYLESLVKRRHGGEGF